jgi:hypothetical protein
MVKVWLTFWTNRHRIFFMPLVWRQASGYSTATSLRRQERVAQTFFSGRIVAFLPLGIEKA